MFEWFEPRCFLIVGAVAKVTVKDVPRYAYRGMHLDVGRNFKTKEKVKQFLDMLAMYKFNKFHFHLCEDEGWRLEIPGLDELTQVFFSSSYTISFFFLSFFV